MLQSFCQYIIDKSLFLPSDKILLTVSGGVDSVVMADLFFKAGFKFSIAHCNFKLRGEESEGDEVFVKNLAQKYKVDFFRQEFNTAQYADSNGISIQMAARELRYEWFYSLVDKKGFKFFATAHHRNDVLESVLLNLTKGTSIQGLTGIRLKKDKVVRPLLGISREDILQYARDNKLSWREDSSNESTKYQRNKIRLEVIPLLKKINPSLEDTFEETIEKIRAAENIYLSMVREIREKICTNQGNVLFIDIEMLNQSPEPIMVLFEILKEYDFQYSDIKNLYNTDHIGRHVESSTHVALRDRDQFIISTLEKEDKNEWEVSNKLEDLKTSDQFLSFRVEENKNFEIPGSKEIACLDFEKLEFPLKIRSWKEGDWFIPLGLGKKKKVSDLMVDLKIPLIFKKRVKVLLSGENIVWVLGLRADDRFKITDKTRKILLVRMEKV